MISYPFLYSKGREILKLFVKSTCQSSRMTREELIHIVSLSELGFEELIVGKTARATNARAFIMKLSIKETSDFLLENLTLLRASLIVGENKLRIGYHDQEMRQFIPRKKEN